VNEHDAFAAAGIVVGEFHAGHPTCAPRRRTGSIPVTAN
jgi:hypothetical protein